MSDSELLNQLLLACISQVSHGCNLHGLALDMFCVDCLTPLCAKCALLKHKTHNFKAINKVNYLVSKVAKVRAFWQATFEGAAFADSSATSADTSAADVAAARTSLRASCQRVVAEMTVSKSAASALLEVSNYFDHLLAIVNAEASERDKALAQRWPGPVTVKSASVECRGWRVATCWRKRL